MTWVSWRLQRTETMIAVAILALITVLLVPTGIEMANAYHHDGLSACLTQQTSTDGCSQVVEGFTQRFERLGSLLGWLTLTPGLIGVLLAAPFVLELENGTYRLAWTQSVTRRRWIATKLGVAVAAAVLFALALTLLMTWWHTPLDHLHGRLDSSAFDSEGTVVFGYTLFALGLALAVGVVWRRTVPAIIVGFAGYVAARILVDTWLRERLVAPLTATWRAVAPGIPGPSRAEAPANLYHAWVISERPSDKLGHPVSLQIGDCSRVAAGHIKKVMVDGNCLLQNGADYIHAVYHPASRFWLFQGIETALFGGTALLLMAFAAWWTHQRTT